LSSRSAACSGVDAALHQPQFVAVQAGGVFTHQQHGVLVQHRHHHDGPMATTDQPLEMPALAVGELQVKVLLVERADVLPAHVMDERQPAAHARPRAEDGRIARMRTGRYVSMSPKC